MLSYMRKKPRGFSLLEILASIFLMAGFISILVQLSYGNTRRIKKAEQMEKATWLLEKKMMELEEEFKGFKVMNLPKEDEGEFEDEGFYFWKYQTKPLELPSADLLVSLLKVPDNEMNRKIVEVMTEVLSGVVVELKLTVFYKKKNRKVFNYSLVSYFINYQAAQDLTFQSLLSLVPSGGSL